jgi:hypothetical protein
MGDDRRSTIDDVLLTLVRSINSTKSNETRAADGIGLVLVVDGAIISGKLIPNWLWFKEVARALEAPSTAGLGSAAAIGELFGFFGDEMISHREEEDKIAEVFENLPERAQQTLLNDERTVFIHLAEARVYQPGQLGLPDNGMLWRGRLKDIAGWSLGLLSAPGRS